MIVFLLYLLASSRKATLQQPAWDMTCLAVVAGKANVVPACEVDLVWSTMQLPGTGAFWRVCSATDDYRLNLLTVVPYMASSQLCTAAMALRLQHQEE